MSIMGELIERYERIFNSSGEEKFPKKCLNGYYRRYEMAPYAIDSNWPIERTTTAGGGIGRVNNKVISNTWQSMKMTILSRKMLSYRKE